MRDLQRLGLTTDNPGAKKDKRKLIVPACASWDKNEKIDADKFTAEDLAFMEAQEAEEAEKKKGAENEFEDDFEDDNNDDEDGGDDSDAMDLDD